MSTTGSRRGARLLLAAALTSQASSQDLHRRRSDLVLSFDLVSDFVILVQGQIGELNGLGFHSGY